MLGFTRPAIPIPMPRILLRSTPQRSMNESIEVQMRSKHSGVSASSNFVSSSLVMTLFFRSVMMKPIWSRAMSTPAK